VQAGSLLEASALHAPSGLGRITAHGPLLRLRTDDQLVALFRMGYDDAFRVLHDRYRQRLLAYTRQMLGGSRSDAEDVLQDVFLRAYGALRHDDRPVTLRAWLYRVAHNRCIDHLRRPVPPAAEVYDLSRTPTLDPPDETERREDLRRLVQDVQRLPEQQRSALLMRELDGLSYAELADALGTSLPAVKSLLVRARIGLVQAGEARDTACADIRSELALAARRGVRASGRSRRHLRDCRGCRDYRHALRSLEHGLAALQPGPSGPLATLAKLLGLGGASSGAAVSAGAGGSVVIGGAGAATATKVAALVCCAAVMGSGAVEVRDHVAPIRHEHHATARARSAAPATAPVAADIVRAPAARTSDPLRGHEAPAVLAGHAERGGGMASSSVEQSADGSTAVAAPATPEEAQTGGAMAPDEAPSVEPAAPGGDAASAAPTESPNTAAVGADPSADPATTSAPAAAPATSEPAPSAAGSAGGISAGG
jgi:RNA polymerase sigma factor (sigma-70 family)